jgi:predicted flap endonuclease-1-like 5' DNA nuclease
LFNNAGIYTWRQLAETEVSVLKGILDAAGPRYQMHNPGTWARQSEMAADGQFAELKVWQDALNSGKGAGSGSNTEGSSGTKTVSTSSTENTKGASGSTKSTGGTKGTSGSGTGGSGQGKRDDLKIVEGIGPKIEELFNNAGIYTWRQLAETEASVLKGILEAAGPRYKMHNPTTWPRQSEMAADGQFAELKTWQDSMAGGKDNDATV